MIGLTAIFIRQEYKPAGTINHQYQGIILDKFRTHEKVETTEGVQIFPVDKYVVRIFGSKLDGTISFFFPDEIVKLSEESGTFFGGEFSQKLIQR